jgi:subfamily B ATP-binding cassette protein MsbA
MVIIARKIRKARKKTLEQMGEVTNTMIQIYGGAKVIKAFDTADQELAQFEEKNLGLFKRMMRVVQKHALSTSLAEFFMGLVLIGFVLAGGYQIQEGKWTAGDFATFALAVAVLSTAAKNLTKSYNHCSQALAACERLFEVLDEKEETPDLPDAVAITGVHKIEYRGIAFAYNSEPILKGLSFEAQQGEIVAFVGRSGAGKTTIVDLLCKFYDPQGGVILVNGEPLSRIKRASILSHVAVCSQEAILFNASIRENVRYGKPGATQEEIERACRQANIHDFIAAQAQGYETPVGERGAKLSGGERQRLAIARAILKDPSILILDEPTSQLDAESERLVQQAIENITRGREKITFIIAHRLSTIQNADRILVLEDGAVVEHGRHADLINRNGVYASLYRMQTIHS